MPKLLWVLLPLLAAGVLLAWRLLRRRPPSRLGLNIGFSLLLLAYLATTAGLGIFWVANQQLPVFDWHYLFGYATLLLVMLHLGFNGRIVWRYFVRPRREPTAGATHMATRRPAIGLALGLLGAAGAYWLGLRHGRQAVPTQAKVEPAAADARLAQVEHFHRLSSNSRAGLFGRAPGIDWGDAPPPFKPAAAGRVTLPPPSPAGTSPLAALATLLWHSVGITRDGATLVLRAAPSSGALFPTELYVAALAVDGLAPGLWHYDARAHALAPVAAGIDAAAAVAAAAGHATQAAPAWLVATAVFRRSGHKYRERCYRYVLADLGHALQNLQLAGEACGWPARFMTRFDEAGCARALRLDADEEGVLAVLALRAPAAGELGHAWQPTAPVQEQDTPLGLTGVMHAASSLRTEPAGEAAPPAAARPAPALPAAGLIALPRAARLQADPLRLIAVRRSVRRFEPRALPLPALSGVLAALFEPPWLLPTTLPSLSLVVHAVDGLAPGAYRYDAPRHALQPRRQGIDLRRAAQAAALDQDVIGDAAVVFVLGLDRSTLRDDPTGPARAYRHALLQAGCIGERIYLEAGARGLGACAVGAFYDDEAAALVAADPAREWVLHFAALGRPDA